MIISLHNLNQWNFYIHPSLTFVLALPVAVFPMASHAFLSSSSWQHSLTQLLSFLPRVLSAVLRHSSWTTLAPSFSSPSMPPFPSSSWPSAPFLSCTLHFKEIHPSSTCWVLEARREKVLGKLGPLSRTFWGPICYKWTNWVGWMGWWISGWVEL